MIPDLAELTTTITWTVKRVFCSNKVRKFLDLNDYPSLLGSRRLERLYRSPVKHLLFIVQALRNEIWPEPLTDIKARPSYRQSLAEIRLLKGKHAFGY